MADDAWLRDMGFDKTPLLNKMKDAIDQLKADQKKKLEEETKAKAEAAIDKESPALELIFASTLITDLPKNVRVWNTEHVLKWLSDLFPHAASLQK